MASQKQLDNKYKQAQATSDDWYRRAQLALQKARSTAGAVLYAPHTTGATSPLSE